MNPLPVGSMRSRVRGRGGWLAAAFVGLVVASATGGAQPPAPDILLVTIDTLRPDALGFVSGKNATPNIDALARAGFRFPAAVSPAPLTLPAHTSILTGLLPPRHGVRDNGHVLGPKLGTLAEAFRARGYRTAAFVSGYPLRALFGLARGFERYDDVLPLAEDGEWAERKAPQTSAAALAWLATQPANAPVCVWVHYYDPHDPYTPPDRLKRPGARGDYDGEVALVDEAFGALQMGFERARSGRPRLTVLTSDHGEALGEHGEDTHGFFVYDSTALVPLVFHGANLVPAGSSELAPRLVDILPTLVELTGGSTAPGLDGVSLVPLLRGRRQTLPPAYIEALEPWLGYGWAPLSAIRVDGLKLIDAPRQELFDVRKDPGEMRNLAATDPHRVSRLEALLEPLRSSTVVATPAQDPEVAERLRALGYVGGGAPAAGPWPRGLTDPKDRLELRRKLHEGDRELRAGRPKPALAAFEAVRRDEPANRFALLRGGAALGRLGRWSEAAAWLEQLVRADPHQPEARYQLGDALLHAGQFSAAATHFLELTALQPGRAAAWSNLGYALLKTQQHERAVKALVQAGVLEPGNRTYRENLAAARYEFAVIEAQAGRLDAARALLDAALAGDASLRSRAQREPHLKDVVVATPLVSPRP